MSEAYKLRNKIVHGSAKLDKVITLDKQDVPIGDFIEEIGCYLRNAIKNYLYMPERKSKDQILKELEDSLFDNN